MRSRFRRMLVFVSALAAMASMLVGAPAMAANMAGGWNEPVPLANPAAGWLASGCNGNNAYEYGLYHTGRDYWGAVGAEVRAIGDGVVVGNGDFGSGFARALFVRHAAADGSQFVALYGHVNSGLSVNATVHKGDVIATLAQLAGVGSHLHFGLVPGTSYPSSNWGRMPCSSWPATNGFADPIPYLGAHPLTGGGTPPADVTPDLNHDGKPDLYNVTYAGTTSGKVEVHVVNGANAFSSYLNNWETSQNLPDLASYDARYVLADHNGDTYPDLYQILIAKVGAGIGRVEMHILSGASSFKTSLGDLADVDFNLNPAGTWYGIADSDANGTQDLYKVVYNSTTNNKTEVHIRDGSTSYQSWLHEWETAAGAYALGTVTFDLAHNNGDGIPDLYQILYGGVPKPQVHVLSGASAFRTSLADFETSFTPPNPLTGWWFGVADHNGDRTPDLFMMVNDPGSGKMALHIAKGAGGFQQYYGEWLIVEGVQNPSRMVYLI